MRIADTQIDQDAVDCRKKAMTRRMTLMGLFMKATGMAKTASCSKI